MTTATANRRPPPAAALPSRMTLANVLRDVGPAPDRILLLGTEGVGKTSWAAGAPSPIFLCAEDGMPRALSHVPRFPTPATFTEVMDAVRELTNTDHEFKTLVVDTVDWLEPMVWADLCTKNGWKDGIEEPGYGKGYAAATDEFRKFLSALDTLRARKSMEVILLAHAAIRTFQNPTGPDFDRYELKMHKGASALMREWCDVNLFAIHEEFGGEKNGRPTKKGISTGRRVVHTERTAAWHAKNRHGLPPELALDYAEYAKARDLGQPASPGALLAEAESLLGDLALPVEEAQPIRDFLNRNKSDATALAKGVDRLRSKVAQKGGA